MPTVINKEFSLLAQDLMAAYSPGNPSFINLWVVLKFEPKPALLNGRKTVW